MDGNMQGNFGNVAPGTYGPVPQQVPLAPQQGQWVPQQGQLDTQGWLGSLVGGELLGRAGGWVGERLGSRRAGEVVGGAIGAGIGGAVIPVSVDPTAAAFAQQAQVALQQAQWAQEQAQLAQQQAQQAQQQAQFPPQQFPPQQLAPQGWLTDAARAVGRRVAAPVGGWIGEQLGNRSAGERAGRFVSELLSVDPEAATFLQQVLTQQQQQSAQQPQPAQQLAPQLFAPPQFGSIPFNPWLNRVA